MTEVKLTDADYSDIKTIALQEWQSRTLTYKNADNYLCMCYTYAFLVFCNKKGYTIVDGKVYVK